MEKQPPKNALKFLRWFCRLDFIEEIEGDLTEIFRKRYEQSPGKAKCKFIWDIVNYFRPEFIRSFRSSYPINTLSMFRHNFLITYRNFLRYKSSFFINLIGLSSGLASVLLIYLWVYDEVSIDKFHAKDRQLYQVLKNLSEGEEIHTSENNSDLLAPALTQEVPEIEYITTVAAWPLPGILTVGEKRLKATGWVASKDFFNVFSYRLIHGNKDRVLTEKHDVVISDELSARLFGTGENVVGKVIALDEEEYADTYVVSGVFEKNRRSSDQFDFLITNAMYLDRRPPSYIGWHSNSLKAYVILREGVDLASFNVKLNDFNRVKLTPMAEGHPEYIGTMFLEKYSNRYLYNRYENGMNKGGRIDYVILFSTIALFILVIACINFMNLSTARASRRLKEVGIKKAVGALRRSLVVQYLSESMIVSFLSLFVALIIVFLFLPNFNLITGKHLILTPDPVLILGALGIVLITGLISGSYPALYLSRLKPVEVLKGKIASSFGELFARRGLVIFQFSISILLIVVVLVVYQQINFVQTKNLGYEKDHVIAFERLGKLTESLETFLTEAKNTQGVVNASAISGDVTNFNNNDSGHSWEGHSDRSNIVFTHARVGFDFVETLNIKMKEGRSFSKDFSNEDSKIILNETAVKVMQLTDPVGKTVDIRGKREIIGIVKDFHFKSLYEQIDPMYLIYSPATTSTVLLKIQAANQAETLARVEKLYHTFNPGIPFDFRFVDDEYQALYVAEQRVAKLSQYFAGIAILISSLGLFGLAAFTAERRIKEIGIRKILGSSELEIVRMLSADFNRMVLISIVISLPASYLIASKWLERFAYRIDLEWWFFVGAGLLAMVIACITVGVQTLKAARMNPVQSLKVE